MNNRQVAHVWAQQTKQSGKGSSFYFEGATIYSYGPHFPIARFVECKGRKAVLFTTRSHSNSTAKHLNYTHSALYGLPHPVFSVYDPSQVPQSQVVRVDYTQRVAALAEAAARSRKHGESTIEQAQTLATEANACAEFFGWKWRLELPTITPELIAKMRERKAADRAAEIVREERREAARQEQAAKDRATIAAWLTGADVQYPYSHGDVTRLRVFGDTVQTSRGAEVPATHAKRLWPIIQRVVKSGTPYHRNGHTEHVGEFAVDAIEADGTLKAGCHIIAYAELQTVAVALGVA